MKKLNIDEIIICGEITKRAMAMGIYTEEEKLNALIDITATAAAWEMDLKTWLKASDEEFTHDITNIKENIHREEPISFNRGIKLKFTTIK